MPRLAIFALSVVSLLLSGVRAQLKINILGNSPESVAGWNFGWQGGTPPYNAWMIDWKNQGLAYYQLKNTTETLFSFNVEQTVGTQIGYRVDDSAGGSVTIGPYTVVKAIGSTWPDSPTKGVTGVFTFTDGVPPYHVQVFAADNTTILFEQDNISAASGRATWDFDAPNFNIGDQMTMVLCDSQSLCRKIPATLLDPAQGSLASQSALSVSSTASIASLSAASVASVASVSQTSLAAGQASSSSTESTTTTQTSSTATETSTNASASTSPTSGSSDGGSGGGGGGGGSNAGAIAGGVVGGVVGLALLGLLGVFLLRRHRAKEEEDALAYNGGGPFEDGNGSPYNLDANTTGAPSSGGPGMSQAYQSPYQPVMTGAGVGAYDAGHQAYDPNAGVYDPNAGMYDPNAGQAYDPQQQQQQQQQHQQQGWQSNHSTGGANNSAHTPHTTGAQSTYVGFPELH